MKSGAARDAINSIIQDKLRKGSVPGKITACQYGNSILEDLSEIIDKPLTLEEQIYLNERIMCTINEEIKTKLTYKEISLIAIAIRELTRRINKNNIDAQGLIGECTLTLKTILLKRKKIWQLNKKYYLCIKMIKMELKNRIKENRARLDLTQETLAGIVGISRVTLGTIEKGTRKVDLINAMVIASVFGISVDNLFYFKTNK